MWIWPHQVCLVIYCLIYRFQGKCLIIAHIQKIGLYSIIKAWTVDTFLCLQKILRMFDICPRIVVVGGAYSSALQWSKYRITNFCGSGYEMFVLYFYKHDCTIVIISWFNAAATQQILAFYKTCQNYKLCFSRVWMYLQKCLPALQSFPISCFYPSRSRRKNNKTNKHMYAFYKLVNDLSLHITFC